MRSFKKQIIGGVKSQIWEQIVYKIDDQVWSRVWEQTSRQSMDQIVRKVHRLV